jgi:chitin biosynthesis protein CHS5
MQEWLYVWCSVTIPGLSSRSKQILLGERAHLIEFPSILLPPGATTGSIVNIAVHQNVREEKRRDAEFWALQNDILEAYGLTAPENPKLEVTFAS